jgi:hypothetical protein
MLQNFDVCVNVKIDESDNFATRTCRWPESACVEIACAEASRGQHAPKSLKKFQPG